MEILIIRLRQTHFNWIIVQYRCNEGLGIIIQLDVRSILYTRLPQCNLKAFALQIIDHPVVVDRDQKRSGTGARCDRERIVRRVS